MTQPEWPGVNHDHPGQAPDATLALLYRQALAPREPEPARLERARARLAGGPAPRRLARTGLVAGGLLLMAGVAAAMWAGRAGVANLGQAPRSPEHDRAAASAGFVPVPVTTAARASSTGSASSSEPALVPARRAGATTSPGRHGSPPAQRPRRLAMAAQANTTTATETAAHETTANHIIADEATGSAATNDREPGPPLRVGPLADESRRLGLVYTQLRRNRDADAALAEVAQYLRFYPDGVLVHEARLAEIDALLMKGEPDQALTALSRVRLGNRPRELELRLIRGELQARRDCAAASGDFSAVLAARADAPLQERALRGQAACDLQSGDRPAARLHLTEYLRRFPDSQHAARARAQLEAAPAP
jgi:hypothetical protein